MARFPFRPGRGLGSNAHPSRTTEEAATQTYLKGALLIDNGAGFLTEAGVDPVDLLGVSEEAGKNLAVGVGKTRYTPIVPSITFEATMDQAGDLGNYVLLQTDLYAKYGVTKDANGIWYVDKDKTGASARVIVVGFKDPVGTIDARVFVTFLYGTTAYSA